jgi:hypothetical protein
MKQAINMLNYDAGVFELHARENLKARTATPTPNPQPLTPASGASPNPPGPTLLA